METTRRRSDDFRDTVRTARDIQLLQAILARPRRRLRLHGRQAEGHRQRHHGSAVRAMPRDLCIRDLGVRRFPLPVAYIYTAWVIVNMVLYSMKNRSEPHPSLLFTIAATAIGIGVPLATAIILSR